jgi:hypothetical protein
MQPRWTRAGTEASLRWCSVGFPQFAKSALLDRVRKTFLSETLIGAAVQVVADVQIISLVDRPARRLGTSFRPSSATAVRVANGSEPASHDPLQARPPAADNP